MASDFLFATPKFPFFGQNLLTYNDEVDPDLDVAEAVDPLADVEAGVLLLRPPDLQALLLGPDPDPGVVDGLAALPPLHDGGGVAEDGAGDPHVLPQPHHLLHLLLLGYRRTCRTGQKHSDKKIITAFNNLR